MPTAPASAAPVPGAVSFPTSLDAQETTAPLPVAPLGADYTTGWMTDGPMADEPAGSDLDTPPDPCGAPPGDGHPLEIQSLSQRIVHRPWHTARWQVVNALWNGDDAALLARARRIGLCCNSPTFRIRPGGKLAPCLHRCRDRLCPFCAAHRGRQAAAKVLARSQRAAALRLITLTMAASAAPLHDRVVRLLACFKKLRAHAKWAARVRGGIYGIEVTRGKRGDHWHVHLHVVADGEFFPQPLLKSLWLEITGDSMIVDVRAVHDRAKAAKYIAAYVGKPPEMASWTGDQIREFAAAMHGQRLLQPFGSFHGVDPDADDAPEVEPPSVHIAHASTLRAAAAAGSIAADRATEIIARMSVKHALAAGVERTENAPIYSVPVQEWEERFAVAVLWHLKSFWPSLPPETEAHFEPSRWASTPGSEDPPWLGNVLVPTMPDPQLSLAFSSPSWVPAPPASAAGPERPASTPRA